MKEELISFEIAKLADEKGWKFPYTIEYLEEIEGTVKYFDSLPTQSLLQRWLREVHNIHLVIRPRFKGNLNNPIVDYSYNGEKGDRNNIFYPTYEEALEAFLQEALKLIK